jgi:hypothetical protein
MSINLATIPDNTWVKLNPNREPAGRSYSGIHYGNGKIFYFGGGHGSYAGNDVEIYDIATNTWTQQYTPELWNDHMSTLARQIDTNGACRDGQPSSRIRALQGAPRRMERSSSHINSTGTTEPGVVNRKHAPITPEVSLRNIGGGPVPGCFPQGRPHTLHTYQMIVWDPTKNKWMARLAAATWTFNPSTKSWELLQNANPPYGGDVHCHSVSL